MAKKKKNRKGDYTNQKNNDPPVKIKERIEEIPGEQLFPQTTSMVPVKEFDRPLVNVEEAVASWKQYQELVNKLIESKDIVPIPIKNKQGAIIGYKNHAKKDAINKIARFFGYSCEIIRAYKEEKEGPQGGRYFIWRVWTKAIAPTGRFRISGGACASNERMFAHLEHDVYSLAETRSKKRAIEELAGMGELELLEEEEEIKPAEIKKEMPVREARKINLKEEDPNYFHPAPSPKQLAMVKIIFEKLRWRVEKPIEKLTRKEAASIIERGIKAAKQKGIKLVEQQEELPPIEEIPVVEDEPKDVS